MQKRTLLYLDATHPEQGSWVILDENNQLLQFHIQGHLSELTADAANTKLTVIAPAQDVLITSTTLPKMNKQRLMQALPFALEEQLIDDVSTLHFAVGAYAADGSLPVAIVAKQKMANWLELLNQFELQAAELIPGLLALPCPDNNWSVSIQHTVCVTRTGVNSGFVCDLNNLVTMLELTFEETENKPENIHVFTFTSDKETLPTIALTNVIVNKIHLSEEHFLEKAAEWLTTYPTINLLQNEYQVKQTASKTKKVWIAAAWLTVAWITVALVGNITSYFMLHHQVAALENDINVIYKKNFPQSTALVAPRERMEDKLKGLEDTLDKNEFLLLLAKAGKNLPQFKTVQLHNLDFRDKQLSFVVSADSFANLDAFTKAITQQGLMVKQQNAAVSGKEVKATLLIQRG